MPLSTTAVRALARTARLLEVPGGDLTLAQYRVLAMVDGGDERASLLANRLTLAKPTISAVVDGLVERGLLVRSAVEGDRRCVRLALTDAGAVTLRETEAAMRKRLDDVLARVEDPVAVESALCALGTALDELLAERFGTRVR